MHRWARTTRRLTFATWLVAGLSAAELAGGRPEDPTGDWRAQLGALVEQGPAPLASGDADRDGLPDAQEEELARRFAPVVVLDAADWNRPASIPWVLARERFIDGEQPAALYASLTPAMPERGAPFAGPTRKGSDDPADWTTYVHVYPRADGGTNIQYWFYYPYNDGPSLFDHESDWEHVTVRLDRMGSPAGVYLARHEENNPGAYRAWSRVRREGDHPVVFSARGSHATYADEGDLPWFESIGSCDDLERCQGPVWRTWEGGGLQDLGERERPRVLPEVMGYRGRWGAGGIVPGTGAPVGPTQAAGFCHAGFASCRLGAPGRAGRDGERGPEPRAASEG